ncbi:MAG: dTDP-4-dehydrorhamnose 3,5-epimerase [Alphaproteobacteria bacterium]|nr:dTDP-4-dehydrorhamnose 3,5-epimerase [Alphaproteobacteria bacterium]
MQVISSHLLDVKLLRPVRHVDNRGFFSEAYSKKMYAEIGVFNDFVQDNHSLSRRKGVVRGLHFQIAPFAQAKLLRVLRGSIFDVVVDIRRNSPTYGRHIATVLSAEDWNQIFIPAGFAHGFCTLEPDTEILYKVDNYYSAAHDRGIRWNDPALDIAWPVSEQEAEMSEKDRKQPLLSEIHDSFVYEPASARDPVAPTMIGNAA